MDDAAQLKEWAQMYLKSRDVMERRITKLEDLNGDFIVHQTSGDVLFLIRPELTDVDEVCEKANGRVCVVVLNIKKNVDKVIKHWENLAPLKGLCIYFVNPALNEKWLLYPYTHNQITEKASLRRGLESLFSMVPIYR